MPRRMLGEQICSSPVDQPNATAQTQAQPVVNNISPQEHLVISHRPFHLFFNVAVSIITKRIEQFAVLVNTLLVAWSIFANLATSATQTPAFDQIGDLLTPPPPRGQPPQISALRPKMSPHYRTASPPSPRASKCQRSLSDDCA